MPKRIRTDTRIVKDPNGGWNIEVSTRLHPYRSTHWILKRWTSGNKRDALKAQREVDAELNAADKALADSLRRHPSLDEKNKKEQERLTP